MLIKKQSSSSDSRPTASYDAEDHIGIVADESDIDVAKENTTNLNLALAAMVPGGSYQFRGIPSGPVLLPISFKGKAFWFASPNEDGLRIATPTRYGGTLKGANGGGIALPPSHYQTGEGAWGGMVSRMMCADGELGGELFRMAGCGWKVEDFQWWGRSLNGDVTPSGTKVPTLIVIESNYQPQSGRNSLSRMQFYQADTAIEVEEGDGSTHGDLCFFQRMYTEYVDTFFHCANAQSVGHRFDDILMTQTEEGQILRMFKMDRGGKIYATLIQMNTSLGIVYEALEGTAPNANRSDIHGIIWDHVPFEGREAYLTLFKFSGTDVGCSWMDWSMRMSGHFNNTQDPEINAYKIIDVPAGVAFDPSDLLVDVTGMRKNAFRAAGTPWYTLEAFGMLHTGLAGLWRMNESSLGSDAIAEIGTDLTAVDSPAVVDGIVGVARSLDGISQHFIGTASTGTKNKISISAWMNRSATNKNCIIGWGSTLGHRFNLNLYSDGNCYIGVEDDASSVSASVANTGTGWHHYAVVYDGTQVTNEGKILLYIDGVLQSLSLSGTPPASHVITGDFCVGAELCLNRFSEMFVDEVALWDNYALTIDDIARIISDGPRPS